MTCEKCLFMIMYSLLSVIFICSQAICLFNVVLIVVESNTLNALRLIVEFEKYVRFIAKCVIFPGISIEYCGIFHDSGRWPNVYL